MNKDMMQEQIGARVRDLRKERGWTQEQFGELTEMSTTTISRLELGKQMVSVEKLIKIAETVGVGMEKIMADFMTMTEGESEDAELLYLLKKMDSADKEYIKKHVYIFQEYLMKVNELKERQAEEKQKEE